MFSYINVEMTKKSSKDCWAAIFVYHVANHMTSNHVTLMATLITTVFLSILKFVLFSRVFGNDKG